MREIFSSFGNLSIRPSPSDQRLIDILIWPEVEMPRRELAFALNACGTGISQVLAILTAVSTLDKCVILIDEINSFLHPAATKALLRIIATQYSEHQYIITTHAAEVISFAENKAIFLVKKSGYQSEIVSVAKGNQRSFQDLANLLGISMTDVFSSDRVLWVEGPTEELCFAYIYAVYVGPLPRGTAIISATTGDFIARRRDKGLIYEIYTRISSAAASLVVNVGFSFDSEKLTSSDKERMTRESSGKLTFLPRRHLECYLINASAIAKFINEQDLEKEMIISISDVERKIADIAQDPAFAAEATWVGSLDDVAWLQKVDAARLIDRCCGELTDNRVSYMKKGHALSIMKSVFLEHPHQLSELKDYVLKILV